MKVIIVGSGEVGRSIARHLVMEHHAVVMIDENLADLHAVSEELDVKTIAGRGSLPSVLGEAGAGTADMLIAVTQSDEINMVACQIGYSLFNVPKKIARVRNTSYLNLTGSHLYTPDNMPVDVIISPELEVAQAILHTLMVPGAFDAHPFLEGAVKTVGCYVGKQAPLLNMPIHTWNDHNAPFHLLAILRQDRVIIPSGSDHLEEGDAVYFVAFKDHVEAAMVSLGADIPPVRHAFVIGGGNVGYNICQSLEEENVAARVLEHEAERADFLAQGLAKTIVLQGDALNRNLLIEENLGEMDVVLSVTSDDAANILSSILARQLGAKNVMTLINQASFIPLAESVGLDKVISPRMITVSRILQHMRRGHIRAIHSIHAEAAEVIEVEVREGSKLADVSLQDLTLPAGSMLGCLRKSTGEVIMNKGNAVIKPGDCAVVFVKMNRVRELEALF